MRRFIGAFAGAPAGLLALGVTASAQSPEIAGAEAFIKSLADSAIEVLSDGTVTLEDRADFAGYRPVLDSLLSDGNGDFGKQVSCFQ